MPDEDKEYGDMSETEIRAAIEEAEQACEDMTIAPEVVEALLDEIEHLRTDVREAE